MGKDVAFWEGGRDMWVGGEIFPQRDYGWKGRQESLGEGLSKDKEVAFRGWEDTDILRFMVPASPRAHMGKCVEISKSWV